MRTWGWALKVYILDTDYLCAKIVLYPPLMKNTIHTNHWVREKYKLYSLPETDSLTPLCSY